MNKKDSEGQYKNLNASSIESELDLIANGSTKLRSVDSDASSKAKDSDVGVAVLKTSNQKSAESDTESNAVHDVSLCAIMGNPSEIMLEDTVETNSDALRISDKTVSSAKSKQRRHNTLGGSLSNMRTAPSVYVYSDSNRKPHLII
jgi:hypothetical protein